jgi:hypothetical protein
VLTTQHGGTFSAALACGRWDKRVESTPQLSIKKKRNNTCWVSILLPPQNIKRTKEEEKRIIQFEGFYRIMGYMLLLCFVLFTFT